MKKLNAESKTKHTYAIESSENGKSIELIVFANNRTQAMKIAKQNGFDVYSVNMES